jgi:glycosyltransferase involved in cell wall biosynthesis
LKISVIIYTYDRKNYILEAIQSVLKQNISRDQYEIIIVKGFEDADIDREIRSSVDISLTINAKGHGKKIVSAIEQSSGEIICLLDDDDLFIENKLARVRQIFESDNDITFIHNSIKRVNDDGKEIYKEREEGYSELVFDTRSPNMKVLAKLISKRSNWYGSCMSFRRSMIISVKDLLGGIDQSVDPILFLLAMTQPGKIVKITDRLTMYRTHTSTTNYFLSYSEYIEKRKQFYLNTLRNYTVLAVKCNGTSAEPLIKVSIAHMHLIVDFTNAVSRITLLRDSLKLILSMRDVFVIYYLVWVLYSLISIIDQKLGLRIFYLFQVSGRRTAIEMRS